MGTGLGFGPGRLDLSTWDPIQESDLQLLHEKDASSSAICPHCFDGVRKPCACSSRHLGAAVRGNSFTLPELFQISCRR